MYILIVYVPETHKEKLKKALFEAGAGRYQNYDYCCFETLGKGQFRPLTGSQPFIGNTGKVETVIETKLEMLVQPEFMDNIKSALLASHPYQTPAYYFIACHSE